MRKNKVLGIVLYMASDAIAAMLSWFLFFYYRNFFINQQQYTIAKVFEDPTYYKGTSFIILFWFIVYFISGTYTNIFEKSRLSELIKTLFHALFGAIILFFIVIIDDAIRQYSDYYLFTLILFLNHFFITAMFRISILKWAKNQLITGKVYFKTIIIGGNKNATKLYKEITEKNQPIGYQFSGFIETDPSTTNGLAKYLTMLGSSKDLSQLIKNSEPDQVIIAIDTQEHHKLNTIINQLAEEDIIIKVIPDMYDILSGSVKMKNVMGAKLIEIYPQLMPLWQRIIKRLVDIVFSFIALLILAPFFLYIAIRVLLSSEGPIFYKQQRIGKMGKTYEILKFRSMFLDAEAQGPALSSKNDPRITPWGKIMRKWRLDELPQFWNVLKGDMSIVGPRPERKFYIDQIVAKAPEYQHLKKVKPGITSWGMVKYGYAENVDQMIDRMEWDLLYIENMSLSLDFRIMIYTVLILFQGKGK